MALARLTVLVTLSLLLVLSAGRELPSDQAQNLKARLEIGMRQLHIEQARVLENRLDGGNSSSGGGWKECWDALYELRSCTNEIILFFLNGEAQLGPNCCRAIQVITRSCWPAMLVSIGLTSQEGDILRGYCDASAPPDHGAAAPPSLSPVAG